MGVEEEEELLADLTVATGVPQTALLRVPKNSLYSDATRDLALLVAALTGVDKRLYRSLERGVPSSLDTVKEGEKQ